MKVLDEAIASSNSSPLSSHTFDWTDAVQQGNALLEKSKSLGRSQFTEDNIGGLGMLFMTAKLSRAKAKSAKEAIEQKETQQEKAQQDETKVT